jgi:acyl-coenzyme A thioesterase PaaI-like protein
MHLIDEAAALAGDLMTGVIDTGHAARAQANYIRAAHTNGQTLTATGTVIHAGEVTPPQRLASDDREEHLDQVEP